MKRCLWVLLPYFPLFCWSLAGFMVVANIIEKFVLIEEEQLMAAESKLPRMLVEINVEDGLPEEMEVV